MANDSIFHRVKPLTETEKWSFQILLASINPNKQWFIINNDGVATLFGELKSSGFNIKDTHVTDLERLQKYFL